MTPIASDLETRIRKTLARVGSTPLQPGVTELLDVLGYRSDRVPELDRVADLVDLGRDLTEKQRWLFLPWSNARALFQFTVDEMPSRDSFSHRRMRTGRQESVLFLAVELVPWQYSDWDLKNMTHTVNRIFAIPVIVTYRYRHCGDQMPVFAVAAVRRRAHKKDASRDVLEHVALVKDIRTDNPDPVDIELLAELSLDRLVRRGVRHVDDLHLAWEMALWARRALDSFDPYLLYVRDLQQYPLIESPQIEREIARKARAGDRQAAERLVTGNLRFVISYVKKYQGQGLNLAELVCIGNEGLLKAVKKFDPDKGVKFISYAVWWIRQTVLQALAEQTRSVRIPLNQNSNLVKLSRTETALTQKLGRSPTDREIAEELEEPVETVRALRRVASAELSVDALVEKSHRDGASFGGRFSGRDGADIEEGVEDQARREFLEKMFERYLTERERKMLVLYYGLDDGEGMTLEEIGSLLGVTRERIRQIRNRALEKLRASPDGEALGGFWCAGASHVASNGGPAYSHSGTARHSPG